MIFNGGFFDGKEFGDYACSTVVLPVCEDCGRMCGPHFSNWCYDTRTGDFLSAETWIGDMNDPETEPHAPEWPTGPERFAPDAPAGYLHFV